MSSSEPKWLTLARAEIGTLETPGGKDNPKILSYAKDAGVGPIVDHDSVPWCAAFVGAMLTRSGIIPSGKANARSYDEWGKKLLGPVLGCVVVLTRPPNVWQGHVGFCVGAEDHLIQLLAGNQGDKVSIASFNRNRVSSFRWPVDQFIQPEWVNPRLEVLTALLEPSQA